MLQPFPEMRYTAEEILKHPYFADIDFQSIKAGYHNGTASHFSTLFS
jgi:hypothetical protein